MTKQFDLMYTTTDFTEKMSSQTSKDFMSKDKAKFYDNNTFSNFLDNANKNYTKNNSVSNNNFKNDTQSPTQDKRNLQSSEKNLNNKSKINEKSNYVEKENQNLNDDLKTTDNKVSVSTKNKLKSEKTEFIKNNEEIDFNEYSTLVSENTTDDNKISFVDNSALYFQMLSENKTELPATLNDNLNLSEQDIQILNSALENVDNVSKEDLISNLYETDNILNVQDMQKPIYPIMQEDNNDTKFQMTDNSTNNLLTPKTNNEEKTDNTIVNVKNDVNITDNKVDLKEEKTLKVDLQNDKQLQQDKVEVKPINENISDVNTTTNTNNDLTFDDKQYNAETDTNDKLNNIVSDAKITNVEDKATELTSDVKETADDNFNNIASDVKIDNNDKENNLNSEVKNDADSNTVKDLTTETVIENIVQPQHIAESKKDNDVQQTTVDNNATKQSVDIKHQVDTPVIKNTKNLQNTGVITNEQSEIKDDVTGIEFVQQKLTPDTQIKQENSTTDKQAEEIIEPIKIKADDSVKVVQTPLAKEVQNSDKIQKANETLSKSGINTQALQNVDARVENIEMSNNSAMNNQNFGETAKESMLRDKLAEDLQNNLETEAKTEIQNQTQNQTTSMEQVKTDFIQTSDKAVKPEQVQHKQSTDDLNDVDILSQIRSKFEATNIANSKKIVIGLTPESLGKLTIQITKGENGISAHILADNQQAKELLEKDLNSLKSTLQSQGVNVNNLSVKVSEAGKTSDSNNNSMFQQNNNSELGQDGKNSHSEDSKENEQNDRKTFEFLHKKAMEQDNEELESTNSVDTLQTEKTVNIKGSTGKISYKL